MAIDPLDNDIKYAREYYSSRVVASSDGGRRTLKVESPDLHNYKIEIHAVTMNPNYDAKKLAADFKEYAEKRFESFHYKTYVTVTPPKGRPFSLH